MITRYELNHSDDINIIQGIKMDKLTRETMNKLNLKCFRSSKNRYQDRKKAQQLYKNVQDLNSYAIHHMFNGLVGLVPKDIHQSTYHYGYFYRLNHWAYFFL